MGVRGRPHRVHPLASSWLYALQRLQGSLPLNPTGAPPCPDLAFNTAVSFATNTNWQNYAGEVDDVAT